jgi:hypothetical protein
MLENGSCRGCCLFEPDEDQCSEFGDIIEDCPCKTCLIKMICSIHCEKIDPIYIKLIEAEKVNER